MVELIDKNDLLNILGIKYVEIPEKIIFNRLVDKINEIILELSKRNVK